ncbi:DNA topoisomerase (ATP-hydrolyzing) subunit B [Candidatus Woesearchaeota archaeon]|nr:DNA topoisomerase (ATP-hydrolyzing) subunit B [Candidatus Woesearchaeota archaeon]
MADSTADKANEKVKGTYDASSIQVLEGLESVRKRPGMYIGSTSITGLHHLVYEVVDNSVDEALAGFCSRVSVVIHPDGSVTVSDNGRGIPFDVMPQYNKTALEVVMTKLHAGGKFDKKSYKVSGGLHGVGVSVVNGLSTSMTVEVRRDGKVCSQRYEKGVPVSPVELIGDAAAGESGTTVTFVPDATIFETTDFNFDILSSRLRELAFLNTGLEISIRDERSGKEHSFKYDGGIKSFVEFINQNKKALHDVVYVSGDKNGTHLDAAFQYNEGYIPNIFSFVNTINTTEGGTHLSGFRTALTRTINSYAEKHGLLDKDVRISSEDAVEGMSAVVSVKIPEPQFEGQTKRKLGNSEVKGLVESIVGPSLSTLFEENPKVARAIVEKCVNAATAREAARKAKDLVRRKTLFEGSSLPGKLADCSSNDAAACELFIVEGDSAGGSCKQARNREYQAVLPLKGKILNVEKARLLKIFANREIVALASAIGTGVGDDFDVSKLRYHKIILMCDADVDGSHIRTLLLTFFFRYMRQLIEQGHVYIAQPPLYRVAKGRKEYYVYNDAKLQELLQQVGEDGISLQRYKGLGEMNPEQLWSTTMDPERRVLLKVSVDDAVEADKIFTLLMGEEVEPRRMFIEAHALEVKNLDV